MVSFVLSMPSLDRKRLRFIRALDCLSASQCGQMLGTKLSMHQQMHDAYQQAPLSHWPN